ncbi:MAG: phytanoyl-CoA dioxygenase family protein [Acidobacteriota bacterium]|nr:phytanoyl-CoA dioxygenase family protein [Acidobacteriota bacterium]
MDTSFTNSRESLERAKRVRESHWTGLTRAGQFRSIELEGFVVIPDLLSKELVEEIREETSRLPTTAVDYSEHQRYFPDVQWTDSPHATSVVALPAAVELLEELLGDELICTSCTYAESRPGHPGISIHTDAQPYGNQSSGVLTSSPCLVRVLYYLDDLTPECSPFKVIPRSHVSLHSDANPYNRYLSHGHELMVTCRAGSAVIINQKVFHGNFPNHSDRIRRMLAIAYRPAWAGPIDVVPERDPDKVSGLPAAVRKYFRSLNTRKIRFDFPNRPDNMARAAPGISPRRWGADQGFGRGTPRFFA